MNIKKTFLNCFLILASLIFYLILSKIYLDYFDINRHWSSQFDQELTFAYNALLFNSGIQHEFIDHSAYFTILFLSIFIKFAEIFNYLELYNLRTFIEQDNLDTSFQQIIPLVRIYSGISIALWATVVNILFYYISNSKIFSFLLTLIVFTMPGTIEHSWQLRTEVMSSIFMILSLIMLISYFKDEGSKLQILKLFLFFIFLFSAILNKSQIFFYLPLLIIFSLFFFKKIDQINFNFLKNLSEKKYIYYFYLIIIFYFVLKLIVFKGSPLSLVYVLFNLAFINLVFFYLAKTSRINAVIYINHFNLILLSSFILFKSILFIHPSTNEMAFNKTFTDIMGVLKYSVFTESTNSQFGILSIIDVIIINLSLSLKQYFADISIYSILTIFIIICNFSFKKEIGQKIFLLNFVCIIIPILFTFIGSFRSIADYYNIFLDFFFLVPFCTLFNRIKIKFSSLIILILITFTYLNYDYLIYRKNKIKENHIVLLCEEFNTIYKKSYIAAFQKQIPKQQFTNFCKNYSFKD